MSQKTDPTSLRLQKTNKHFSSSWYSDCFYSQMIASDLQTRSYIEGLSEQIEQSQMFSYIQRYYRRAYTYLFFLDAREIRNQREKVLRLSRKGQKHAASIAASTAFLRSCFDSKVGVAIADCSAKQSAKQHPVEALLPAQPSVVSPVSQPDSTKRDTASLSLNRMDSKARHFIKTRFNKAQTNSRKVKTPYSYWWKESLKELPVFEFGFDQMYFIRVAFNCSMFRDIVVQNCNNSNKSTKLMSAQNTQATHSIKRCAITKDVLLVRSNSCDANKCYPFDNDKHSKRQSDTNLLKDRGRVSLKVKKLAQPSKGPFVFSFPVLYSNSFYSFCAIGQYRSKQRACMSWLYTYSAEQSASILSLFHGTTEAAFLLAYPAGNDLAKKEHKKCVNAANSTDSLLLAAKAFCTKPSKAVCAVPKAMQGQRPYTSCFASPLKSHVEHLGAHRTQLSARSAAKKLFRVCNMHKHPILTSIYPIRIVQDVQFAGFLAQEIAYLLQKGVSFKQVQNRILSEHKKNEIIKGIRLSCSGRIGGRSKKAQKSKIQSVQWGETSLHVLSSKLSFASKSANTPFGKIGIKLWLCFQ